MAKFSQVLICFLTITILQINSLPAGQEEATKCPKVKEELTCTTPQCIHSASHLLKNMNQSVEPCDDFYEFACGNFPEWHVIPDDQSHIGESSFIQANVMLQIQNVLDDPIKNGEPRPFVMAKTLYNLCYDTKTIEENGAAPLQSILTRLGGWPVVEGSKWKEENFDWKTTTYKIRKEGYYVYDMPIKFMEPIANNSSQNVIFINQGQQILDRKILLLGLENEVVQGYYDYIVELAVLLGANKDTARAELKEVINFEIEIAKITMTIRELQDKFRDFPWLEFINNSSQKQINATATLDDLVDIDVLFYFTHLLPLLNSTSQRVLHNHLILQVVINSVPYLSKKFKKAAPKFEERNSGINTVIPRWMECVQIVNLGMRVATSALYARKYFNGTAKQSVEQLVKDVRDTFNDVLKNLEWMDEETKVKALEKSVAMNAYVAYPQELLDDMNIEVFYTNLNFSSHNYLESILKINRFMPDYIKSNLSILKSNLNWIDNTNFINTNGYYSLIGNSIVLPAGSLQGIVFNNDRPHYINYASIGFWIGHEITHGFDDLGSGLDKNALLSAWWGEETRKLFIEKTQCFIDQYSNFTIPSIEMHANGIATQRENFADNGGIKNAYLAYEKWIERNGEEPRLPGLNYTPKQLFWISAANFWCTKQTEAGLKLDILTSSHSPSKFRIIGVMQNSDSFAKDFNCPLGSYMNPSQKCKIW